MAAERTSSSIRSARSAIHTVPLLRADSDSRDTPDHLPAIARPGCLAVRATGQLVEKSLLCARLRTKSFRTDSR